MTALINQLSQAERIYMRTGRTQIEIVSIGHHLAYGVCARSARGSQNLCPDVGVTFHVCLNDLVYLAAISATRNEPNTKCFLFFSQVKQI